MLGYQYFLPFGARTIDESKQQSPDLAEMSSSIQTCVLC
jgi:hypothetical protein